MRSGRQVSRTVNTRWPVVSFSVLLGDGIVQAARKVVVDHSERGIASTLNKLASDIAASR